MEELWLALETRVRTLMKEIMEPTIRRAIESKDAIEKFGKQQEIITYRLDDLDMNMGRYSRKIATVDDMSKRIAEFESSIRLIEVRFNRDREEIKTEIGAFGSKLIHFEEYLNVFDHTKDALKDDLTNLTYAIQSAKNHSEDRLELFKEHSRNKFTDLDSSILKIDVKLAQYDKSVKSLSRELGDMNDLLQTTAHMTDEVNKKTKDLRKSYKIMKKNAFDSIEKLRLISIKNMTEAQASDRKILDVIANELPLRTRVMMSETLYTFLNDPFQRYQLAQFELQKFNLVSEGNLTSELRTALAQCRTRALEVISQPKPESPSLQTSSFDNTTKSKQRRGRQRTVFVIKKHSSDFDTTAKNSKKIKRRDTNNKPQPLEKIDEEYAPRTSSLKKKSNSTDRRNDSSIDKSIRENVDSHLRKSEMMSLNDYQIIKDELQIARYNSLIHQGVDVEEENAENESFNSSASYPPPIDYHPLIDEAKALAKSLIDEVKEQHKRDFAYIKEMIKDIKDDIEKRHKVVLMSIDKVAADAHKNLKELELILNQALAETTSAITMRKRDQSDFIMEIKGLNQKAEGVEEQYGAINERMDSINKNMDFLTESIRIMNALSKQDEVDRESIALMGYKDAKTTKNSKPVVSIEKQCLSCTGQSSVVLAAFKIACLAYSPSSVSYRDSTFTRKDLIDIQHKILSNLKSNSSLQPSSILEELRGSRSKTATNIKMRPLSVPSSHFTLNTPRADFSLETEFPPLSKKHGYLMTT